MRFAEGARHESPVATHTNLEHVARWSEHHGERMNVINEEEEKGKKFKCKRKKKRDKSSRSSLPSTFRERVFIAPAAPPCSRSRCTPRVRRQTSSRWPCWCTAHKSTRCGRAAIPQQQQPGTAAARAPAALPPCVRRGAVRLERPHRGGWSSAEAGGPFRGREPTPPPCPRHKPRSTLRRRARMLLYRQTGEESRRKLCDAAACSETQNAEPSPKRIFWSSFRWVRTARTFAVCAVLCSIVATASPIDALSSSSVPTTSKQRSAVTVRQKQNILEVRDAFGRRTKNGKKGKA